MAQYDLTQQRGEIMLALTGNTPKENYQLKAMKLSVTCSLLFVLLFAYGGLTQNKTVAPHTSKGSLNVEALAIPMKAASAQDLAAAFAQTLDWPFPTTLQVEKHQSGNVLSYKFGGRRIYVDLLSGDLEAFDEDASRNLTIQEVQKERINWKSDEDILPIVSKLFVSLYNQPAKRKFTLSPVSLIANLQPYENGIFKPLVQSANIAVSPFNQTQCLSASRFTVGIDRATRQFQRVDYRRRPCLESKGILTLEQAKQLSDWILTQGKANVTLKLGYELDAKQKEALKPHVPSVRFAVPYVEVVEDKWFLPRFICKLGYSFGLVYVDLRELRLLNQSPREAFNPLASADLSAPLFDLPEPMIVPKPNFLPVNQRPLSATKNKLAQVWFNGASFTNLNPDSTLADLFYPPIVDEGSCLILADYFPSFLININRENTTIVLKGKLKEKGKTAVVNLGNVSATVDGKPITLSTAPQEIDGRLYLPYELLTLCNGVLTRWEPKKNTLWVDTRFLRRP